MADSTTCENPICAPCFRLIQPEKYKMMQSHFRTETKDASLAEILDRILDKGIVLESWVRVVLNSTDLVSKGNHMVLAEERRRRPFIVPYKRTLG